MHPAAQVSTSSLIRARVAVTQEGLRRAEGEGAGVGPHLIVGVLEEVEVGGRLEELGDIKVGYLESDIAVFQGDQNVVGFEVAVDHGVFVEEKDAAQQLPEHAPGDRLWLVHLRTARPPTAGGTVPCRGTAP